MPPALPVVRVLANRRNAGKTWLARALIEELTSRGFAVGAVKHSHHTMPLDKPGSDTELFTQAGAARVVFVAADGVLERTQSPAELEAVIDDLRGRVDIAIVEGFKSTDLGAELRIDADTEVARLTSMDGRLIATAPRDDARHFASAIVDLFEMASGGDPRLGALVRRAAAQHGHQCPGVTLGVRMALAAVRALDLEVPAPPRRLEVTMETARCASDAIASATGCSPGRRDFTVEERGIMAARFRDRVTGRVIRVEAREAAKEIAVSMVPGATSRRHAQAIAYRVMPEDSLLAVTVLPPTGECRDSASLEGTRAGHRGAHVHS